MYPWKRHENQYDQVHLNLKFFGSNLFELKLSNDWNDKKRMESNLQEKDGASLSLSLIPIGWQRDKGSYGECFKTIVKKDRKEI